MKIIEKATAHTEQLADDRLDVEEVARGALPSSTLASRMYERLRDEIVSGALAPGKKLTLELLKERYGLGMTPLREALYRLSASKLVTLEDRRGFHVAAVSPVHLCEVIQLRTDIESLLLRDAFKHADLRWESNIVGAYHSLQRAADYKFNPGPYTLSWEQAHRAFHFAMLSTARLPMLQEFHLSVWDHVARYRNLAYTGRAMSSDVFHGHEQLMQAVIARDEELAGVLLRRHISLATSHVMEAMFPEAARGVRKAEAGV